MLRERATRWRRPDKARDAIIGRITAERTRTKIHSLARCDAMSIAVWLNALDVYRTLVCRMARRYPEKEGAAP